MSSCLGAMHGSYQHGTPRKQPAATQDCAIVSRASWHVLSAWRTSSGSPAQTQPTPAERPRAQRLTKLPREAVSREPPPVRFRTLSLLAAAGCSTSSVVEPEAATREAPAEKWTDARPGAAEPDPRPPTPQFLPSGELDPMSLTSAFSASVQKPGRRLARRRRRAAAARPGFRLQPPQGPAAPLWHGGRERDPRTPQSLGHQAASRSTLQRIVADTRSARCHRHRRSRSPGTS